MDLSKQASFRPSSIQSAVIGLAAALYGGALQAQQCTAAAGTPPSVDCSPGAYPGGIVQTATNAGLVITGQDLQVGQPPGTTPSTSVILSTAGATGPIAGPLRITIGGTSSTFNASGAGNIYGLAITNNVLATQPLTLDVTGTIESHGQQDVRGAVIFNQPSGADATLIYRGPQLNFSGLDASGLHVRQGDGTASAIVDATGNITGRPPAGTPGTSPLSLFGIMAENANFGGTGTGNVFVRYRSGTIDMAGSRTFGIYATSWGAGSVSVITDPGTTVRMQGAADGNGQSAIVAYSTNGTAAAGNSVTADIASTITNAGLPTPDPSASRNPIGIRAFAGLDAPISVTYRGAGITTSGGRGIGINAQSGSGAVNVQSNGPISTNGLNAYGILVDSGGLTRLAAPLLIPGSSFPNDEPTAAASGVGGAVAVSATAPITTRGVESHGIWANSATGNVTVDVVGTQLATGGQFSVPVLATAGSTANVNVASGASLQGGWQANAGDVGPVSGKGAAAVSLGSSATATAVLNNAGTLGAASDQAIFATGASGGTQSINNLPSGVINGFATLGAATTNTVNNQGTWNLRHFADTDGDGVADTLRVAVIDMGTTATGRFENGGTLVLAPVAPSPAIKAVDATNQYLPFGNATRAMAPGGPMQGQVIGVGPSSFVHSGTIDLQANPAVGDVLLITGSPTRGAPGPATFTSNGGTVRLDAVLNEGGAASRSDMLVVDGTAVGAGGPSRIQVRNAGGSGALTTGDGIALVEVLDKARSAAGAFVLQGAVVAGPYEYRLLQGGVESPGDANCYLRSEAAPPPPPDPSPSPPPAPSPPPEPTPLYRPEVAAYLSNQRQAGGMFLHSLHDRLGEPQWIEGQRQSGAQGSSAWLRVVNKRTDSTSSDGVFSVDTDSTLLQGGGDMARWAVGGETGRLHLGGMLGYGSSNADAHAIYNPRQATGKVEGWSAGLYTTWFQNDANKLGAYVDVWGLYGWFRNRVGGELLPEVKYDASALMLSGEVGYAMRIADTGWVVEPQGQLVYVRYDEDSIVEPNGTRIDGGDGNGWVSRLGVRVHRTWVRADGRRLQPYATLNWWHDDIDNGLRFNTVALRDLYPSDRYEVKVGLNGDLARGWSGWANVGYQWGSQSYHSTNLRVGAKYSW